jgi:hypothetical protein
VRAVWQVLFVIYLVAVATNYVWELAQSALFVPGSDGGNIWLHCFIASLGDGVMVLLLYAVGWLTSGTRDWFTRPTARHYAAVLGAGALLALLVEAGAVHVLQRWSYGEGMPRLPGLEIGLVPIMQMIVLPPLVFWITGALTGQARPAKVQRR